MDSKPDEIQNPNIVKMLIKCNVTVANAEFDNALSFFESIMMLIPNPTKGSININKSA
jgi:hypothetical protein